MESWIQGLVEQYGYWGILILVALENVFPPIPSEVILTFGGYMTTQTDISVTGVFYFSDNRFCFRSSYFIWTRFFIRRKKTGKDYWPLWAYFSFNKRGFISRRCVV
ncbi:hypothetical protein MEZE111188_19395 [Mesobacillus zeae]